MRGAAWFLVVGGCGFSAVPLAGDDTPGDAPLVDVPTVMIDGCTSFSTQLDTCIVPVGAGAPLDLTGTNTYNTVTHVLTRNGQNSTPPHATVTTATGTVDVIYVSAFSLASNATLRAIGTNMFGIVASGTVQINGKLDLAGPAAGSRTDAQCGASVGKAGSDLNQGAGGGGGGAFQGDGGTGGDGNSDGTRALGGVRGTKIARPASVLGGCDGGNGGKASGGNVLGGDGGGAVLIAAGVSINVGATGVITVNGGGGDGGNKSDRGGGGGGSGGMMLLESAQVAIAGALVANGGGGGEGHTNGTSGSGGLIATGRAPGGAGAEADGGDGASGGALAEVDGETVVDFQAGGGGGGGGGAGYIAIRCAAPLTVGATISPAFTAWP